jgi:hypothetical protein
MLRLRLADGLELTGPARAAGRLAAAGLLDHAALARGVARLTLEGRLLADRIADDLLETETDLSHRCHPLCDAAPVGLGQHIDDPPADLRLRAERARPVRHRQRGG